MLGKRLNPTNKLFRYSGYVDDYRETSDNYWGFRDNYPMFHDTEYQSKRFYADEYEEKCHENHKIKN